MFLSLSLRFCFFLFRACALVSLGHLGGAMKKQTTPNPCPFDLFDTIFERLGQFILIPAMIWFAGSLVVDHMRWQKEWDAVWAERDASKEAREALNAAQ